MSSYILKAFKRKRAKVKLTNEQKVNLLSEKAVGLFDYMEKAHTELQKINEELIGIAEQESDQIQKELEEHEIRINKLKTNRDKALDEMNANIALQKELERFIR